MAVKYFCLELVPNSQNEAMLNFLATQSWTELKKITRPHWEFYVFTLTIQASSLLAKHIPSRGEGRMFFGPLPKVFVMRGPVDLTFGMNVNWTTNFHFIQIMWQLSCYHGDQDL